MQHCKTAMQLTKSQSTLIGIEANQKTKPQSTNNSKGTCGNQSSNRQTEAPKWTVNKQNVTVLFSEIQFLQRVAFQCSATSMIKCKICSYLNPIEKKENIVY